MSVDTRGSTLGYRHQRVQRLRRLLARRSYRQTEKAFVIEGARTLSLALEAGIPIEAVFAAAGTQDPLLTRVAAGGVRVFDLAPGVLERVADTVSPQPILAVVPVLGVALDDLSDGDLLAVCVDIRDPGNLGTVLRSAEAAGASGVVCCEASVDVYNPKTVRASAGSLFHVPVVVGGQPEEVLKRMGSWGLRRLGARARGGTLLDAVDLTGRVALVLGNEAHGVPPGLEPYIDDSVSIPMAGRAESLNVGMAAAVLCFEAARQRRLKRRAPEAAE